MERLDRWLVQKGMLPSRESARGEILQGQVLVNGQAVFKPGHRLKETDEVIYTGEGRPFVSRGAWKLQGAMEAFRLDFTSKTCIDVGASTGGFTHFMLEHGAKCVTSLDVGHDQLDPSLKVDSRVTDLPGVNFRTFTTALADQLKEFDLLTMDISFISTCLMVDSVGRVLKKDGEAVILIKPQFEAGPGAVNRQGVVKDPLKHVAVLTKVLTCYLEKGFRLRGLTHSPIQGPHGNIEYLCYLTCQKEDLKGPLKPLLEDVTEAKDLARKTVETAFRVFEG